VLSVALLLEHLGETAAAQRVEAAVAQDLLGRGAAPRTTGEVGEALLRVLG
jgi:3-isopropylmalate dehydrogenase